MSSLARVRNSGSLCQSNICNIFFLALKKSCPCYRGVCYCGVSTRRELTVWLCLHKCSLLTSDRKLKSFIKMKSLTLSLSSGRFCSLLNPLQCSFEIHGNSISLLSPLYLKKCFKNDFLRCIVLLSWIPTQIIIVRHQGGYSGFQMTGMTEWGQKSNLKKKNQGLPTKPPKIPGSKLNPEKSHAIEYASTTTNPLIALNTQKYPHLN